METEQLPKAKHPYALTLESKLQKQYEMMGLLEEKRHLLKRLTSNQLSELSTSEELEHVERQIQLIRTQGEIDVLKKVINEKEKYFRFYMVEFEKDEADMLTHWKHTLSIAERSTKPNVIKLLANMEPEFLENNLEHKIAFYKQLRKPV